jgi:ATP/ADP translocase
MQSRGWFVDFVIRFIVIFVTTIVVTLLWNLIEHRNSNIDWPLSFCLAIILGIALPIIRRKEKKD